MTVCARRKVGQLARIQVKAVEAATWMPTTTAGGLARNYRKRHVPELEINWFSVTSRFKIIVGLSRVLTFNPTRYYNLEDKHRNHYTDSHSFKEISGHKQLFSELQKILKLKFRISYIDQCFSFLFDTRTCYNILAIGQHEQKAEQIFKPFEFENLRFYVETALFDFQLHSMFNRKSTFTYENYQPLNIHSFVVLFFPFDR